MSGEMRIAVIGGDKRLTYMAEQLQSEGYLVTTYLVEKEDALSKIQKAESVKDVLLGARLVIMPTPFSKDGVHIFSNTPTKLTIKQLLSTVQANQILFGGNIQKQVRKELQKRRIRHFDFMEMEEVALRNAVATAEGAIVEALHLSDETICDSPCLVLGYGRCGRALAVRLAGLRGKVVIAARNPKQRQMAEEQGFGSMSLETMPSRIKDFAFIFNTIPARVLGKEHICQIRSGGVLVDLASKPGGTDFEACQRYQIPATLALGLPGKYAPRTSADILVLAMKQMLASEKQRGILWS